MKMLTVWTYTAYMIIFQSGKHKRYCGYEFRLPVSSRRNMAADINKVFLFGGGGGGGALKLLVT